MHADVGIKTMTSDADGRIYLYAVPIRSCYYPFSYFSWCNNFQSILSLYLFLLLPIRTGIIGHLSVIHGGTSKAVTVWINRTRTWLAVISLSETSHVRAPHAVRKITNAAKPRPAANRVSSDSLFREGNSCNNKTDSLRVRTALAPITCAENISIVIFLFAEVEVSTEKLVWVNCVHFPCKSDLKFLCKWSF